ncbi:MAG TPA: VIT domain-containing protein, partial [bacterium]|nr:VIT domain-containing protein [bacterium]
MKRAFLSVVLALLVLAPAALADGILIPHPIIDLPQPVPFGIKYHHVDVTIREAVATTAIDQVFTNKNARDLEATYLFPIPEQAAISRFAMWIDSQPQEATLRTAEEARQIYEDIVRRMQDPALLEYAGRNLFKARVYPVPAHGEKRIALNYSEVLTRRGDAYEYVYPLNTEKFSSTPISSVRVTVVIEAQRPLRTIYSPSHDIEVVRQG